MMEFFEVQSNVPYREEAISDWHVLDCNIEQNSTFSFTDIRTQIKLKLFDYIVIREENTNTKYRIMAWRVYNNPDGTPFQMRGKLFSKANINAVLIDEYDKVFEIPLENLFDRKVLWKFDNNN